MDLSAKYPEIANDFHPMARFQPNYPFINVSEVDPSDDSDLTDLAKETWGIPYSELFVVGDDDQGIEILSYFLEIATYTESPEGDPTGFYNHNGITIFHTNDHGYSNYYLPKSDLAKFGVWNIK